MLAAEGGHLEVTRLLLSIQEINIHDFGNLSSVTFHETASTILRWLNIRAVMSLRAPTGV